MDDWMNDIYVDNDELEEADKELFSKMLGDSLTGNERLFFEQMKKKEEGEFAPSADLIISEHDNDDEIYLVRYYFSEYKLGKGKIGDRAMKNVYTICLSDMLETDLYPFIGRHATLLDWLRGVDFKCVNYNGNYAID